MTGDLAGVSQALIFTVVYGKDIILTLLILIIVLLVFISLSLKEPFNSAELVEVRIGT